MVPHRSEVIQGVMKVKCQVCRHRLAVVAAPFIPDFLIGTLARYSAQDNGFVVLRASSNCFHHKGSVTETLYYLEGHFNLRNKQVDVLVSGPVASSHVPWSFQVAL